MHKFDEAISVTEKSPGILQATISAEWSINGNPNGGYLMALMTNAMVQSGEKRGNPILTANFISRCRPGDAEIHVERISQSHQFDRFEARLIQGGRERIRVLSTFSAEGVGTPEKRYERSEPQIAGLENCVPVPALPNYTLFSRLDVRLDPSYAGWMTGSLSETSEIKGWIRFNKPRSFDLFAAILMADAFPPAILSSHGIVAWVPTIECSINVRNVPQAKWLKGVFRTSFVNYGMLEEDGEMWDERGELVGISRQFAQIRTSTR